MFYYLTVIFFCIFQSLSSAAISVTTSQYDALRTGANISETVITPANVAGISKLGTWAIDGKTYSQPLIRCGVSIGGASCVMLVVSMHDSVFLFDANRPGTGAIWSKSVGTALTQANYPTISDLYHDEVGCVATPVIDTATNVIYAVCVTQESGWQLFSWNLADGTNFHAPVTIAGTNNGVTFVSTFHLFRSALLLAGNNIILSGTGYGDNVPAGLSPYQGWLFSYNKTTLAQVATFSDVNSTGGMAGFWMSGGGPVYDGSNILVVTGNGDWNGTTNLGDSFIRFNSSLAVQDFATPDDYATLNANDRDINSGKLFVTGNYVIGGGKDGRVFVLDKSGSGTMGGMTAGNTAMHQLFVGQNGAIFSCTVFANNSLIIGGNNTTMKRYAWDAPSGTFNTTAVGNAGTWNSPGPACSYSSNGSDTSSAILWGVVPSAGGGFGTVQPGILIAWGALFFNELFRSDAIAGNAVGNYAKFATPTVANGYIYVPTFSNQIDLFGFPPAVSNIRAGKTTRLGKTQ